MPFSKANRQPVRCLNPECRSVKHGSGRILAEHARSVVFKEAAGDRLAVMGMWLYAECGICHERRYNPEMAGFDGMFGLLQRTGEEFEPTVARVADRDPDRRGSQEEGKVA